MGAAYMADLMQSVDRLATRCKIAEPARPHTRGNFAQLRIGWNHGMGEADNVSQRLIFAMLCVPFTCDIDAVPPRRSYKTSRSY